MEVEALRSHQLLRGDFAMGSAAALVEHAANVVLLYWKLVTARGTRCSLKLDYFASATVSWREERGEEVKRIRYAGTAGTAAAAAAAAAACADGELSCTRQGGRRRCCLVGRPGASVPCREFQHDDLREAAGEGGLSDLPAALLEQVCILVRTCRGSEECVQRVLLRSQ
eukprot:747119-Hanusia_phi.AAC.1